MSINLSPLVSIITPTYNHESVISQCIESVLEQDYENWEQIIIDDGSTDQTAETVRRYADPRIRYFCQNNIGVEALAHTYNRALSLSRGEFIAILEGDDFWPPEKLARSVPVFQDDAVVLAYGEMREADANGKAATRMSRTSRQRMKLPISILNNNPPPAAAAYMLTVEGHSLIQASTVVIRRTSLDAIGGFQYVPGQRAVDFPTFIQLTKQGQFRYSTEVLGHRRLYPNSTTALFPTEMLEASRNFLSQLLADSSFGLNEAELKNIENTWRGADSVNHFILGRGQLLERNWSAARRNFRQAIGFREARVSLGAFVGWCLTWLRCDMEALFRLAGRAALRQRNIGQAS